ncbi:MAG TPA: hypothetical protein VIW24_08210 [Aldersonia sp.]
MTSSSIEMWHRGRLGEALAEADRTAEGFDLDFALVVAMAAAELGDYDRALRTIESLIALPRRLSGPKVAVRVPLLIKALLAVGQSAPEHRHDVARPTAAVEPVHRGWADQLVVQWPGLVCLGPAGVYRGTARAMPGLSGARENRSSPRSSAPANSVRACARTGWRSGSRSGCFDHGDSNPRASAIDRAI